MPLIRFTQNIQRHVSCPERSVPGSTLREALEEYFSGEQKSARGYVLDDQGSLRKHMAIFIDSEPVMDRASLGDTLSENAIVDVVQALSGG